MKKVTIILCFTTALVMGVDFSMKDFLPNGISINRVTTIEVTGFNWAVGDSGQAFELNTAGGVFNHFTLNEEYNLTGVSFAPFGGIGYIVGYKRNSTENGPKWKGGIWKTIDGGTSWSQQANIIPPFDVPTPFLDVSVVDVQHAWISCGHGYVLSTSDGGEHWYRTPAKPSGPYHFGWLWVIDAIDANTAWVCSDQSGLIAMTTNGGDTWISYK